MTAHREPGAYRRRLTPIERLFSRSPFSIVTMVARIRGHVTEAMVREATARVRLRHPNLRSRIVEDERGDPWLTSEGAGEIAVTSVAREGDDHWARLVGEASWDPFAFEEQPAVRITLVQSTDTSDLVIMCHHILCDGLSLSYLARDLLVHLGDPMRGAEPLPDPIPIEPDNAPEGVSVNPLVRFVIGRMNKRWATEKVTFDAEDYAALNDAYWGRYPHQVLSVTLDEAATAALVDRCRSNGVTVNSALSAAFVGAQVAVQGPRPHHASIGVAASLRERLPQPPGEAMGFYAGLARLSFRYDGRAPFWHNARRFHRAVGPLFSDRNLFRDLLLWSRLDPTILEAINFKRLGALVAEGCARHAKLTGFSARDDVVLAILKRDGMDSLERITMGTAVTNLGRLDLPRQYGALALDRLIMKPGGAFPLANVNLVLGAVTCAGKLSLVLEWVADNLSVEAMGAIRDRAMGFLLE